MSTFLGVPILLRGVAYANFYLTEKTDGEDFTDEDQEMVELLAGQAAVAIENARLYAAATQWSKQLESLNEVGNALATETELEPLLDLVARRLLELLDARLVTVLLPAGATELRFVAVAGEGGAELIGQTMPRAASKSGRVIERGRSERVDSVLDDPEEVADAYPDIPIVGFTNHTDTGGLRAAHAAGFDQVVAKSALVERAPLLIEELLASVE